MLCDRPTAIWKYPLKWAEIGVQMPKGAEILSAGLQDDQMVVWARVDPTREGEMRHFRAFNTGQEIPQAAESMTFIATLTHANGIVWHVFEVYIDD